MSILTPGEQEKSRLGTLTEAEADVIHARVMASIRVERLRADIGRLERCESPDRRIDDRLRELHKELAEAQGAAPAAVQA